MPKVTVGYRYFLGMHLGICAGPVDAVMELRAGDRTAWAGNVTTNNSISVNAPNLFGGEEREGGLQGTLDVMMGGDAQAPNAYLVSQHGADTPAYRGILSLVWRRGLVACTNPYVKPWAVKVRRILKGWQGDSVWYSAKASITLPGGVGQAMNPAHIVYECITNAEWGMGYGATLIDDANFRAAADTFHAEGMGLCLQWTQQTSIEAFIQHVMDHAGANLAQDRKTGLFKIIPIRSDYDVGDLLAFDESNVLAIESYQRPALPDAVNEITVKYQDLATGAEASITVQNLANITSQGGVVTQSVPYPGLPTGALATRVALRDLRARSTPLAKIRFRANRSAADLLPGQVVKLSWPKLGIDTLVLRILKVNTGTLVDGAVSIEAAEDVFGLPLSSYASQQPTGWQDPSTEPAVATNRIVREATYYETLQRLGSAGAADLPEDAGYVVAAAGRPSPDSLDFGINTRTGSAAFAEVGRGLLAPGGELLASIDHVATTATLVNTADLDLLETATFGQIGDEIIRLDAVNPTTGAITIGRGVLDTVAAAHAAGARVFFLQDFSAVDETQRVDGEVVDVRLTPRTGRGELDVASAPTNSITLDQRILRPYPPGRFRINSLAYPASTNALRFSWAHRDRTQQNLEGDESGDIGPEAGTSYTLEIRDSGGALIHSKTGIGITSYNAPTNVPGGNLNVRLWSVRGGLASLQRHDWTVFYSGPEQNLRLTEEGADVRFDEDGNARDTYPADFNAPLVLAFSLGQGLGFMDILANAWPMPDGRYLCAGMVAGHDTFIVAKPDLSHDFYFSDPTQSWEGAIAYDPSTNVGAFWESYGGVILARPSNTIPLAGPSGAPPPVLFRPFGTVYNTRTRVAMAAGFVWSMSYFGDEIAKSDHAGGVIVFATNTSGVAWSGIDCDGTTLITQASTDPTKIFRFDASTLAAPTAVNAPGCLSRAHLINGEIFYIGASGGLARLYRMTTSGAAISNHAMLSGGSPIPAPASSISYYPQIVKIGRFLYAGGGPGGNVVFDLANNFASVNDTNYLG